MVVRPYKKATASLVIVDKIGGQEIEKLGDKIKEVSDQIEQILGLNAEQFKQIILLPQNDFSRFLKEDSKTKTQILKKIFGTGILTVFKELGRASSSEQQGYGEAPGSVRWPFCQSGLV